MKALFNKKWFKWALMGVEVLAAAGIIGGVIYGTRETKVTAEETEIVTETEKEAPSETEEIEVVLKEQKVNSITAAVEDLEMNVSDTFDLQIVTDPEDAVVTYKYSIGNIVSVKDGIVTALNPGRTFIRILAGDKDFGVRVNVLSPMEGISFTEEEYMVSTIGEVIPLEVLYQPENTTDPKDIVFTSSDEEVCKVNEEGLVVSTGLGECEVTAKCNGFTAVTKVNVFIPIKAISFSFADLNVNLGDSVQIPIFYDPVEASGIEDTKWESSNEAAVTVNEQGVITVVGAGTAEITAENGELVATARITGVIPVTGVAISTGSLTLNKGEGAQLSASVVPGNTTESPFINFASDNTSVATVDGAGNVVAIGPGTCVITASHDDYYASCTVTVLSPMTGILLDQGSVSLTEGGATDVSVSVYPEDTTDDRSISFSSSDESVVTVDPNGHVVAVSEGTATITATSMSRGFTSTIPVTIYPVIPIESVSISEGAITLSEVNQTYQLYGACTPEGATGLSWSSDNSNVAVVNENGVVTAKDNGTCTIYFGGSGVFASCTVTVSLPMENKVVVLDPGHNGSYTGAAYGGYNEEIINLKVAYATKAYLEANYAGVTVYMTRSGQEALGGTLGADLEARAQIAQNVGADILVSQHFNASNAHTASGALVFVSNKPNVSTQCNQLGSAILNRICGATGLGSHGCVATASNTYFDEFGNPMDYYAINRHAANRGIPGIIVEHCFMDVDTAYLSDDWLNIFGACDAQGIADYLGLPHR